ncbi:CBS domain-containing protein [Moorella naiadis]|uniref:magnesium transporter MgtE N-terminal domain-containing protein n=1 Tax=Moorella naiadis (nom. illeg.) TaxID=3093670 RepID=UPI003D9CAC6D
MEGVKILGEFFLSQVLGKVIMDKEGRVVGRLRDMAIRWDTLYPIVTGIKYAKDVQQHVSVDLIEQWDKKGLRLKSSLAASHLRPLCDDEIYVGKWLLDKQIIDLKGFKLVRVNDIKLAWIDRGNSQDIVLLAVDIGLRGLMRRIGLESLAKKRAQHLVGWQYIKPLETKTANLRLNLEQSQIKELHPADLADIIDDLDSIRRNQLLANLDNKTTAEALAEAELDTKIEIIANMDSTRASKILAEMPYDEAADILGELSDEKSNELLGHMAREKAQDVRELMKYPENTAGALMTTEFIAFPAEMTAEESIAKLRELAPSAETIYYLYVIDAKGVLKGVLSLRDLIVAPPQTPLESIMRTKVISVKDQDNYDIVLETVTKYNLLAVPVVNADQMLAGIITIDDVIDIMKPDRSGLNNFTDFMLRRKPGWRL